MHNKLTILQLYFFHVKEITMLKSILLLSIILVLNTINAQTIDNPEDVWSDIIEVNQSILQRHVVYDIPGMIAILVPDDTGKYKSYLIGRKVLKNSEALPELKSKPTVLYSDIVSKSTASKLSYLSFVSATMSDEEEVRFSITETSYTSILDNDIDWDGFDKRIAEIKKRNSSLPQGTKFGVVKVASIITVDNQKFKKVRGAAKISGWGFSGDVKHLSQSSEKRIDFKVGVSLTFSDIYIEDLITVIAPENSRSLEKNKDKDNGKKSDILKQYNEVLKKMIAHPIELNENIK